MMHYEVASNLNVTPQPMQANNALNVTSVLEELFILLEDYAPVWYRQEHHDRAVRALLGREN